MSENNKSKQNTGEQNEAKKSGNMIFMVLGILIIAGIAALAFVSNTVIADQKTNNGQTANTENIAQAETAAGDENMPAATGTANKLPSGKEIKEGNPVVAKVGSEDITRMDVLKFIAQLPVQMRQQPLEQLFPMALEQTINAKILEDEAKKADMSNDKFVTEQIEEAKQNIIRTAYVQKVVSEGVTDEALKVEYEQYKKDFKPEEEVKARHILLQTEDEAKDVIKQLNEGADFEELATKLSTGPSAAQGGDLGYFVKGQMVPEFSDVAFSLKPGEYTKTPLKTQFGFHVVKIEDKRQTEPAPYDEVKPFIEQELKRNVLDEKLQAWRKDLNIQTYDINGDPVAASDTPKSEENKG